MIDPRDLAPLAALTDPNDPAADAAATPTDDEVAQAIFIIYLEAARAAGMPEDRARGIHDDIALAFARMKPGFPTALVDQIEQAVSRRPRA